jgi:hypothetical protein
MKFTNSLELKVSKSKWKEHKTYFKNSSMTPLLISQITFKLNFKPSWEYSVGKNLSKWSIKLHRIHLHLIFSQSASNKFILTPNSITALNHNLPLLSQRKAKFRSGKTKSKTIVPCYTLSHLLKILIYITLVNVSYTNICSILNFRFSFLHTISTFNNKISLLAKSKVSAIFYQIKEINPQLHNL